MTQPIRKRKGMLGQGQRVYLDALQAERAALRKKISAIVKHKVQPIMAAMKAEFAKLPEAEQKALLGCAPLPTGPLAVRRKR